MRRFYVNGKIYTAEEYGKYLIKKQYQESNGNTQDPSELRGKTKVLEGIGLMFINSRIQSGDNRVYEVDIHGNKMKKINFIL